MRTDCSLDHVILLLHAFAKLSVRPSQPYWALVSQRLRDAALVSRSNAVRLCLAAAKLDHRGVAIGHLARADGDGTMADGCRWWLMEFGRKKVPGCFKEAQVESSLVRLQLQLEKDEQHGW